MDALVLRCGRCDGVLGVGGKSDSGDDAAAPDRYNLEQYGHGEYDEATGLWEHYDVPEDVIRSIQAEANGETVTLRDLFGWYWPQVEADLHDVFGIDIDDHALMMSRTWRWLATRIFALVDRTNTRTHQAITAHIKQQKRPGGVL